MPCPTRRLPAAISGSSCGADGGLLLQSRGHYLQLERAGGRERQFNIYKQWARAHEAALLGLLGDRYVMYGEWLYAKHSLYYDALPHWFCEFDIWDRQAGHFLDTRCRRALLAPLPVLSVPVLYSGVAPRRLRDLLGWLAPSLARSQRCTTSKAIMERAWPRWHRS